MIGGFPGVGAPLECLVGPLTWTGCERLAGWPIRTPFSEYKERRRSDGALSFIAPSSTRDKDNTHAAGGH